jgi:transposase
MSGVITARSTKKAWWSTENRFRAIPTGVEQCFIDLPPVRIAMEAGTHSIWISQQLQEMGHEVIVAKVRNEVLCRFFHPHSVALFSATVSSHFSASCRAGKSPSLTY